MTRKNRLLEDDQLAKTEDYLAEVLRLARESTHHLTNLKVGDLETVLEQFRALRSERLQLVTTLLLESRPISDDAIRTGPTTTKLYDRKQRWAENWFND
jgi:hypothetical protein